MVHRLNTLHLLVLLACGATIPGACQEIRDPQEEKVFTVVDEMPRFPGGEEALFRFLREQIKYPAEALEAGVSGTVYTTFVVEEDGSIKNPRILRGVNEWLDNEALRVIGAMPDWAPGRSKGEPCRVQFNLPIKFKIAEAQRELVVDALPRFPGGEEAEKEFIRTRLGQEDRFVFETDGTVLVSFVVELDGSLSDIRVEQSIRGDVDSVMVRIVQDMPNWEPATCGGSPCRFRYELPFHLGRPPQEFVRARSEVMPSFPGGEMELLKFLGKNLVYPAGAANSGVGGVVYLTFVIETDGSIQDIKVLRGVRADLDREAVNVVKKMPAWSPGMEDGVPVRVQYNLPIRFTSN